MRKVRYGSKEKRQVCLWNDFRGVDYAHAPANVADCRCVDGMNMVRSETGKIHKRTGYQLDEKVWEEKINGVHFLRKGDREICLIHSGTGFYVDGVCVYTDASEGFSHSVQMGERLFIADGRKLVAFDGDKVKGMERE